MKATFHGKINGAGGPQVIKLEGEIHSHELLQIAEKAAITVATAPAGADTEPVITAIDALSAKTDGAVALLQARLAELEATIKTLQSAAAKKPAKE